MAALDMASEGRMYDRPRHWVCCTTTTSRDHLQHVWQMDLDAHGHSGAEGGGCSFTMVCGASSKLLPKNITYIIAKPPIGYELVEATLIQRMEGHSVLNYKRERTPWIGVFGHIF